MIDQNLIRLRVELVFLIRLFCLFVLTNGIVGRQSTTRGLSVVRLQVLHRTRECNELKRFRKICVVFHVAALMV